MTFGLAASARVPVIDTATLTQATETAQNTAQIMNSNQQILNTVNQTLAAVTGNRSTGGLSSIGLNGFSLSSAPNMSSLLGGGSLSMGGLGSYARVDGALYVKLSEKVSAQLNVENLAGARYYVAASADNNIMPGAPRSAFITLRAKF